MRSYRGLGSRNAVTPQNESIPGSTQVLNSAGGYVWEVDIWTQLKRFLILGSEGGTYYTKERELTKQNAAVVEKCLKDNPLRTVQMIVDISVAGRAPKNEPALLALAMAAANDQAKGAALAALPKVARIGTHLLHFLSYVEQFRGWGPSLRRAVGNWFNDKEPMDLAYQVTKYPSRDKWAMSDALRLSHPKPRTEDHKAIYKWVVDREMMFEGHSEHLDNYMRGRAELEHSQPGHAAELIRSYRLPREVVPTELLNSPEVWEALLQDMPITALVRNLATLTRVGLLAPMSDALRLVQDRLGDTERIKRSRIHPIQVLAALTTYKSGRGQRGSNTWTPMSQVIDALDGAFYTSFGNVEASGKRTLLGLDVSGSMAGSTVNGIEGMSSIRAEAAMAMITARVEPNHAIVAFDTAVQAVAISPRQRLDDVEYAVQQLVHGGTACAAPILWAKDAKIPVDTFVIYTDSETWAGPIHPKQALDQYRQAMGIPSKLVAVAMCANTSSIKDPNDAGMMDVAGFDTSVPSIISQFS